MVQLTEKAVGKVKEIMATQEPAPAGLRIAAVGGGCSGFSYQLDFDDHAQEGDVILSYDDVHVRVDPTSLQYLQGLRIDYVSSLSGGGFKFINPKATHTCGCGSSFSA
jgi:iron-sulfur cluster assembly accessory protein